MERQHMVRQVEGYLEEEGFKVSEGAGCFDILAKKDFAMILKVLMNVDSFTHTEADDLKTISTFLDTMPVVIGERSNRYSLQESVIYERFGIATMSHYTLRSFVKGVLPSYKSRRGGITVRVDPEKMESGMKLNGLSISDLASVSGLSRKTIYKCSKGDPVDQETYELIEKILGVRLTGATSMNTKYNAIKREPRSSFKKILSGHLKRLGFEHSFISRSPFNLLIKERNTMVSVASQHKKRMTSHSDMLHELGRDFDIDTVFITLFGSEKHVDGIPLFSLKELKGIESQEEFLESVEERQA